MGFLLQFLEKDPTCGSKTWAFHHQMRQKAQPCPALYHPSVKTKILTSNHKQEMNHDEHKKKTDYADDT